MSRIPLPTLDDMTPEQRERYESAPGGKSNLGRLLSLSEAMQPGWTQVLKGMTMELAIPPLERQICVMATIMLERGAFEWAQHLQVAKVMGVPDAKVEAIADHRFGDPVFDAREKALLAFTRQVVKCVRVDDFVFDAVKAIYSPRQIVELIQVISIYMMFARVSEVAELEIDAIVGADFWKESNRKVGLVTED